jgi:DNA-directed RNA polymerase subunit RPC12/RpoP
MQEVLQHAVRETMHTFHPKQYAVADELLKYDDWVPVSTIAAALSLHPNRAETLLTELKTLHFALCTPNNTWGFDYKQFYDVMLRRLAVAQKRRNKTAATYVCTKCKRGISWEDFARAGAAANCQCGGKIERSTDKNSTELQTLQRICAPLRKLKPHEVPVLRTINEDEPKIIVTFDELPEDFTPPELLRTPLSFKPRQQPRPMPPWFTSSEQQHTPPNPQPLPPQLQQAPVDMVAYYYHLARQLH